MEMDGGTSILEGVGHRLQSLEERLHAENESHDRMGMVYTQGMAPVSGTLAPASLTLPAGLAPGSTGGGALAGNVGRGAATMARQTPHLRSLESTPNRPRMMILPSRLPATETETDKKLKQIMKQTGILTINGRQYETDIKDLEHLSDLGNGTSGNVVRMRHVPSDTIIAVKQMRRTGNAEENKRILMDLNVVRKSHDCKYIVQCLGYFVRDPDVWICMELMSMCFDKLLKLSKKPVPEPILGKVTVATVKALSYLKEKHNVIHRDVKPSNILIDERGNIKLCDFGISGRLVDSKANTRSAGCAAYMAPERIDPKKPEYDIRADVWSLGITLVELATGQSPYKGCNTDFEVLTKVLDSEPPSLPPNSDGYDFSPEFRAFVNKCLTKNHQFRPKYPELLEQPFIKYYAKANVDVPNWFKSVVETAGIRTHHRTFMPTTLSASTKSNRNAAYNVAAVAAATTTTTTNAMTINAKSASTTTATTTQIPSYQQYQAQRYKRDEQQQQQHQPSQLPQPIATYYAHTTTMPAIATAATTTTITTAINNQLQRNRDATEKYSSNAGGHLDVECVGSGIAGGSGSSSSAASSSPQSPPSIAYHINKDEVHNVSEMNKLYRKSPFMQRKYNNGGSFKFGGGGGGGGESPKKESMLSSISQSIRRSLTTSPFSQKKHTQPQPNQIDPLWLMPTTQDVALAFDGCDAAATNAIYKSRTGSPVLGRKRFQNASVVTATSTAHAQQQQQSSLIPVNRNETNPQRVQGNHSPIVLQRFYHQQNQLREKEFERQQQQQQQLYAPHSPENTNPFLSNYLPTTTNMQHYNQYQQLQQQSQIPIAAHHATAAATATTAYSTSSQSSSTQSSACSQVAAAFEQLQQQQQHTPSPPSIADAAATSLTGGFGIGAGQLQYQPLPQQYMPSLHSLTTSPPESLAETIGGAGMNAATSSKLGKLYARRQLQTSSASSCLSNSSSSTSGIGSSGSGVAAVLHSGASKENSFRDEQGWFNSIAGAMKRQFASYVKLQLNSAATSATPTAVLAHTPVAAASASHSCIINGKSTATATTSGGRTPLPLYQRTPSAASSSSNTSNSTSPTELPKCRATSDFHDGLPQNGNFLRRYAASANGAAAYTNVPPHAQFLAGLDRRHRSPDPPPRYNRGQSPLLLRKNLLEFSGQPPGSPLLNRRYVTASPPLPPPRRGSESVPGSPQHFRTRIHYTPEPQRRIYRTIDQ